MSQAERRGLQSVTNTHAVLTRSRAKALHAGKPTDKAGPRDVPKAKPQDKPRDRLKDRPKDNLKDSLRDRAEAKERDGKDGGGREGQADKSGRGARSGIPRRRAPPDWKKIHAREERIRTQVSPEGGAEGGRGGEGGRGARLGARPEQRTRLELRV